MIARLKGTVLETTPLMVVIDAGGLGYEVHIPITTAEKVPTEGNQCSLFIHSVYREDSASLYGFATREDRDFFSLLVEKVPGIGPKIGIAILSRMSVELLRGAIASSDIALLSKCPGIGKKTAERLVIELKDKVGLSAATVTSDQTGVITSASPGAYQDAVSSLIILGYKPADADKFVRKASSLLPADASVEALVKKALS
ncbi:MAG: Holliday junction DNA helicase RuvA [Lentimonas sp.]|jgi:Holliday junction DNA helicase RuvA